MSDDWNLTQAWAWIRWRDAAKVVAYAVETHLGLAEAVVYPDGAKIAEEDHRGALLSALQAGKLAGRGLHVGGAPHPIAISAEHWRELVPVPPSEARLAKGRKVAWRGLSFAAADLQRLWPGAAPPDGRKPVSLLA